MMHLGGLALPHTLIKVSWGEPRPTATKAAESINSPFVSHYRLTMSCFAIPASYEILLYDLASNQMVCFSPVVARIRLVLGYKGIPYKAEFLEFPDIQPTLSKLYADPRP